MLRAAKAIICPVLDKFVFYATYKSFHERPGYQELSGRLDSFRWLLRMAVKSEILQGLVAFHFQSYIWTGLKEINDRFGPAVGSQALGRLADVWCIWGRELDARRPFRR